MYPDFANILYTISYTIEEESLKILEWANNNVQAAIGALIPLYFTVYSIVVWAPFLIPLL